MLKACFVFRRTVLGLAITALAAIVSMSFVAAQQMSPLVEKGKPLASPAAPFAAASK